MDYLSLGPVPCDEACQQVGTAAYDDRKALEECYRYRKQLEARFPIPDDVRAYFCIKAFPHDFGNYREVCVKYNDNHEPSAAFDYFVEDNLPATWEETEVLRRPVDATT